MSEIKLINIIDEDFVNYKVPTMSLLFPYCSMKCNIEAGREVCQNTSLCNSSLIEVSIEALCERYLKNPISKAICCYGMEPFDSHIELFNFISILRHEYHCNDTIVIYTGYTEDECQRFIKVLKTFDNIIIKFGRFIPNSEKKYEELLGVELASSNQYAKLINENYTKSKSARI